MSRKVNYGIDAPSVIISNFAVIAAGNPPEVVDLRILGLCSRSDRDINPYLLMA